MADRLTSHTEAGSPFAPAADDRRGFLKKVLAVAAGAAATLIPLGAGAVYLLDPVLRRTFIPRARRNKSIGNEEGFVRVAALDALPADGRPQKFAVVTDQADAWNYFPDQRIGNVYLRKLAPDQVVAYSEICPHLGCSVAYDPAAPESEAFRCPCHASAFSLDGKKANEIPPRNLDVLEVKVNGNDVLVRYRKYRPGVPERIEA